MGTACSGDHRLPVVDGDRKPVHRDVGGGQSLLGRTTPKLPCDAVLYPAEWQAVYVAIYCRPPPAIPPPLPTMLEWIARLDGHLCRKCDGPPNPQALWIGLQRARDLAWGMQLTSDLHAQSNG